MEFEEEESFGLGTNFEDEMTPEFGNENEEGTSGEGVELEVGEDPLANSEEEGNIDISSDREETPAPFVE